MNETKPWAWVELHPLPQPASFPLFLPPQGPTPCSTSLDEAGLPALFLPIPLAQERPQVKRTVSVGHMDFSGLSPPFGQLRVITASLSGQGEGLWLGSTMFSCLWLSSTGTFRFAFSCVLTDWKRLRMASLMVPSCWFFLALVFWMSAQRAF